ncbi:MAG: single-stranded DNA-binding protein [Peptostreptococcaceae bacterium]|nr:single-stranded DNA-binding protein [Peptostreptococcaceae bacterium]
MNRCVLTGRITNKPELRKNEGGTCKCQFSIAVQRFGAKEGTQDVDFINCTVWNKQAENLVKYQDKGSLVGIEGELRNDRYTDSEGNDRTFSNVLANRIEYIGGKKEEKKEESKSDPFEEFSNEVELTDEDLPF